MRVTTSATSALTGILTLLAIGVQAQGQSEPPFIEVLVKNAKPIRVEFNAQELKVAESNPESVRKKLVNVVGKAFECSEARRIGDGIWACRDGGPVLRTRDEVLKRALAKLFR
jgi:hypothetical protein